MVFKGNKRFGRVFFCFFLKVRQEPHKGGHVKLEITYLSSTWKNKIILKMKNKL